MENTWKAFKSRPHDPDSWEWEISSGNLVVASRLNEPNAERIVKAVNSYDAMKEALKGIMCAYGASDGRNGNSGECWDKCRAVVALAEGK